MDEMDAAIKFPGLANAWTMPITTRIDMLSTGIKTSAIRSENSRPNAWVYVDIRTSDINGYVVQAKEVVASQVTIPAGYTLWCGLASSSICSGGRSVCASWYSLRCW